MTDRGDAGGIIRNGLRTDPARWRATQQAAARRYADKQQAQRRARASRARMTSTLGKPQRPSNDWPAKVRAMAKKRSGGVCEIDGTEPATDLHHRKHRRHGDHTIQNALHVCRQHHTEIHARRLTSEAHGWIVHSSRDPAKVAVAFPGVGAVYLAADGRYEDVA